jgi:hypothetical protein
MVQGGKTVSDSPAKKMLEKYQCKTPQETRDALREIIQEICLVGFERAGLFNKAAFYGGTALRIFHKLNRFSEDLDFSLLEKDKDFNFEKYLPAVEDELGAFGFDMKVDLKHKTALTPVQSAFAKGNTLVQMMNIQSIKPPVSGVPPNELLKIKLEIDTDPPPGANYDVKYGAEPIPYSVRLFDLPSLFAGKISALLFRKWKSRLKGRDFFDYVFFLENDVPVNLAHLEARIRQNCGDAPPAPLDIEAVRSLLLKRFAAADFEQAKEETLPFVSDPKPHKKWCRD